MVGIGTLHTTYLYGNKYDNFSLLKSIINSLNDSYIDVVIRPNNAEYCSM